MKQIILDKENSSSSFLYEQLYLELKNQIINGDFSSGEKFPSIRHLATDLEISVTTVMQSYNQLLAEGYIKNKPGSGYYVENVAGEVDTEGPVDNFFDFELSDYASKDSTYIYDEEAFDFNKWKKCSSKIYTEYSDSLMFGADIKGEPALRNEISKYLHQSRGVSTSPDNIIIAAGTQQIIFHLSRILRIKGIRLISVEKPGYTPVKSMFKDAGFTTSDVAITDSGINIDSLPVNIQTSVYVSPSNQFPTGVVMPIGKRYEILKWADSNDSFIIEDDYNSELRYFGKPLPTIKNLDTHDRVVYLGSFSSTLFPAIKISYMVLPSELTEIFENSKAGYSQTCSKAEQLTLAYYMSQGYYYTTIRKKRALYTKKLKAFTDAFEKYKYDGLELVNTNSGLFVTIKLETEKDANIFLDIALQIKIYSNFVEEISTNDVKCISIYYSMLPLVTIELIVNILLNKWRPYLL